MAVRSREACRLLGEGMEQDANDRANREINQAGNKRGAEAAPSTGATRVTTRNDAILRNRPLRAERVKAPRDLPDLSTPAARMFRFRLISSLGKASPEEPQIEDGRGTSLAERSLPGLCVLRPQGSWKQECEKAIM